MVIVEFLRQKLTLQNLFSFRYNYDLSYAVSYRAQ